MSSSVSSRPTPPSIGGSSYPSAPSSSGSSRPTPPSVGGSSSFGSDTYRPMPPSVGGSSRPLPPSTGGSTYRPVPPSTGGSYRPLPPSTDNNWDRPTPPPVRPYYPTYPTNPSYYDPYVPRYYPFPIPVFPRQYYDYSRLAPSSNPSDIAYNFQRAKASLRSEYYATSMTSSEYSALERSLVAQAVDQLEYDARGYSVSSRLDALRTLYNDSEMTSYEYNRIQQDLYNQGY